MHDWTSFGEVVQQLANELVATVQREHELVVAQLRQELQELQETHNRSLTSAAASKTQESGLRASAQKREGSIRLPSLPSLPGSVEVVRRATDEAVGEVRREIDAEVSALLCSRCGGGSEALTNLVRLPSQPDLNVSKWANPHETVSLKWGLKMSWLNFDKDDEEDMKALKRLRTIKLARTNKPRNLSLDDPKLQPPSIWRKIKYLWTGLTNNKEHKATFLLYRGELSLLLKKTKDVSEHLYTQELEKHEESDDEYRQIMEFIEFAFNTLNGLLVVYNCDLWVSMCPMEQFLHSYVQRRDAMVNHTTALTEARVKVTRSDRLSACSAIARIAAECDTMGDYIKMHLANTDQLPFKIMLFIVNIVGSLGQYVYHNFINPDKTFLCEEKP